MNLDEQDLNQIKGLLHYLNESFHNGDAELLLLQDATLTTGGNIIGYIVLDNSRYKLRAR